MTTSTQPTTSYTDEMEHGGIAVSDSTYLDLKPFSSSPMRRFRESEDSSSWIDTASGSDPMRHFRESEDSSSWIDTASGSDPMRHFLELELNKQMQSYGCVVIAIHRDRKSERTLFQKRNPDAHPDSLTQSNPTKSGPSPVDDFEQGVAGHASPHPDIVDMADRMIQAALDSDLESSEVVIDDDDGMLLLEFTLVNGLVIEAELETSGTLNASVYNEYAEDEPVRYLLNASEEEFIALFM